MGFWTAPDEVPARIANEREAAARADGEAAGKRAATRDTEERVARLVMSAFSLTERYPDAEEERTGTRPISLMFPGYTEEYTYTVKTPGWGRLLADLKAVAEAQDVAEAAKRLGVSQ